MNRRDLADDEWTAHEGLLNDVRRSVRYHDRREMFFARANRLATGASLMFGSGAMFTVKSEYPMIAVACGLAVVAVSTFNLVVGASDTARRHADLKRRFIDLEARMIIGPIDRDAIVRWQADRLRIEADEPPIMRNLDRLCRNELALVLNMEHEVKPLSAWARLTANLLSGPESQARAVK